MQLAINGGEPIRKTPFPYRKPYGEEELQQVREALEAQDLFYTAGNKIVKFEKEFAEMYGVKSCYTVSSGTAALHTAVAALTLEPGTE
ncbi:MAG: DegT/DnrJ/EryC1/StrS family aminotransferase, partial [Oscillospiraceae bacterium]|nr:DegT/DnrJ/EryC1/StrS family aminotransferase [Oscillospiraceae bacterium]